METWDAYDGEFNKIGGVTLIRGGENPGRGLPFGL